MPIEIREVVIKAQLEKSTTRSTIDPNALSDKLEELKEEILAELLEKIEDRRWKTMER